MGFLTLQGGGRLELQGSGDLLIQSAPSVVVQTGQPLFGLFRRKKPRVRKKAPEPIISKADLSGRYAYLLAILDEADEV